MGAGREKVAAPERLAVWGERAWGAGRSLAAAVTSTGSVVRIGFFIALMALVGVAGVVSLDEGSESLDSSAALMATSARQRVLWQQMAFQAFTIGNGHGDDRTALRRSVEQFEQLLSVMRTGGKALDYQLPAPPAAIRAKLEALAEAWRPYRDNLLLVAEHAVDDPAVKKALSHIAIQAPYVLKLDYSDYLAAMRRRHIYVERGTIGLQLLVFFLFVVLTQRRTAGRAATPVGAPDRPGERRGHASPSPGEAQRIAYIAGNARDALRKLEEAARGLQSEQRYTTAILASLPCGVVLADAELNVACANPAAASVLGVVSDELPGCSLSEIVGTDELRAQAQAVVASNEAVGAHYVGPFPAWKEPDRVLSVVMRRLSPPAGDDGQIVVVLKDSTNRVKRERAASSVERQFETVLGSAVDAVLVAGAAGVISYANRAAEQMFGWSGKELAGQPITKLMPEQFRKRHEQGIERFSATGKGSIMNSVLRVAGLRRDGRIFPLEMSLSPVSFDGGQAVVAMLREASAKERADEAVSHSEARFRSLSEQLPDAIAVEQQGQVVYLNPAALRLLGYESTAELAGRPILGIIHPGDREKWRRAAGENPSAAWQSSPVEIRLLARDQETVDVEAVALMIDFAGQPATASIFRDVTERKQLHAQLMHADRMASMGTLAAGIAHEINNPVGFVHSNLGALEKYVGRITELLDFYHGLGSREGMPGLAPVEEFLREAAERRKQLKLDYILSDIPKLIGRSKEGTERIKKIVGDLKTFARSDEGLGEVDVNRTLELALNIAWNEIKYKAEVVRDFGEIRRVRGSSTALGQVFLNILVNAAQAIPDKGTITVKTSDKGESVRVEISDTGSGIPPEHLKKIFDPFFTTKPPGKGTGLGLNIAYNIMRRHNGRIEVESKQGEGTIFTIELAVGGPQ